ncbi:MAG: hypothetical protein DRP47_01050 [Candidatus Zixiibacteriota bacterium]|nr:MAG: hypothetical protein DRP47_01050 [candidate division Zixibacteria bacterium]
MSVFVVYSLGKIHLQTFPENLKLKPFPHEQVAHLIIDSLKGFIDRSHIGSENLEKTQQQSSI